MPQVSELMAMGMPGLQASALGSVANIALTATGSTQANAASLGGANWVIVTSGAGNTGVILPPAAGQGEVMILNGTGNTIIVYAALTEKINNIASATGVSVTNGKVFNGMPAGNAWLATIV